MTIVYCKDCGKLLAKRAHYHKSKRCKSCAGKLRIGKKANSYINGNWINKHYCIDCGKKISYSTYKNGGCRCASCAKKGNFNPTKKLYVRLKISKNHRDISGKNNPMSGIHLVGELNGNWQGGVSESGYSYKFNNELKEKIRHRDNYKCQLCGMTKKEHYKKYNQNIDVHHIDYNKQNCNDFNLITLCKKCNTKVNTDRDYWYAYFTYILKEYLDAII